MIVDRRPPILRSNLTFAEQYAELRSLGYPHERIADRMGMSQTAFQRAYHRMKEASS